MKKILFLILLMPLFSCEKETVEPKLPGTKEEIEIALGDWDEAFIISNSNVVYDYTLVHYTNDTILNESGDTAYFQVNTEPYKPMYNNTSIQIPAFTDLSFNVEQECTISINNRTFEATLTLVDSTFEVLPVNDELFSEYYTSLKGVNEIFISVDRPFLNAEFYLSLDFDGMDQAIELFKAR